LIYPVIRRHRLGELVPEKHPLEDLLAEWSRPARRLERLREFFSEHLTRLLRQAHG
jgi:hypothetical protein